MKIRKATTLIFSNPTVLLVIVLLASAIIRFALLPVRWINPDEGAHLMDARLFLEGFLPIVDYGSRQPFYVLILSILIKIFGNSYKFGRLLPLLSNLGAGWLIYLIGGNLYNKKVGLLASVLFLFLPLSLAWSTVVKTEPLAILLICVSLYCVTRFLSGDIRRSGWLLIAGIFAGLAYYVRQPSIAVPAAVVIFLIIYQFKQPKVWFTGVVFFVIGFVAVCFTAGAFYLGKMQFNDILLSQLNPLNVLYNRGLHTIGLIPESQKVVDTPGFRILDQNLRETVAIWRQTFFLAVFLIFGAMAYTVEIIKSIRRSRIASRQFDAGRLLSLWAVFVIIIYIFQSISRGFFSQYFTEALPPLCLLTAAFLVTVYQNLKVQKSGVAAGFVLSILFYGIFFLQHVFWYFFVGLGAYVFLAPLVIGVLCVWLLPIHDSKMSLMLAILAGSVLATFGYVLVDMLHVGSFWAFVVSQIILAFSVAGSHRRWSMAVVGRWQPFVGFLLICSYLVLTAGYSGRLIGPKYDCIWSPQTVVDTVNVLKSEKNSDGSILSGGMIWQFEANLNTFLNTSHPTEFLKKRYQDFENGFVEKRPKFIIDDGYTSRKYSRYRKFLTSELESNYQLVADIPGSRYPVRVYKLHQNEQKTETIKYVRSENRQ